MILPVLVPPMLIWPVEPASSVRLDVPPAETASAAVAETAEEVTPKLLTVLAVNVPPDTLPPLKVPPEIVAPLIVAPVVQVKLPLAFAMVQPVEAEPPPRRMSPVDVPPMRTWPVPEALRVRLWLVPPAATESAVVDKTLGVVTLVLKVLFKVKVLAWLR